jgi:hypothetical protein
MTRSTCTRRCYRRVLPPGTGIHEARRSQPGHSDESTNQRGVVLHRGTSVTLCALGLFATFLLCVTLKLLRLKAMSHTVAMCHGVAIGYASIRAGLSTTAGRAGITSSWPRAVAMAWRSSAPGSC